MAVPNFFYLQMILFFLSSNCGARQAPVVDVCAVSRANDCVSSCHNVTLHDCHTCVEIPGGYSCSCPVGYSGDARKYGTGCVVAAKASNERDAGSSAKVVPRAMLVAAIILGVLMTIFVGLLQKCLKKRKNEALKRKYFIQNGGTYLRRLISTGALVGDSKVFSPEELEIATNGFNENRIIGRGGQANVFKAMLRNGRVVAIKRAKTVEGWIRESFINEIIILLEIKHDNVVGLIGFCLEAKQPLLVYEYIPNGSLYHILHEQRDDILNSWQVRRRIIREVAEAIAHLHAIRSADFNGICHRDIKSLNILLDQQYRSVLSDFGISRFLGLDRSHLTTQLIGSFGYIDPELQSSGEYTKRSDVYSYGVVIAELLTGEEAISKRWGNLAMQLKSAVKNDNISAILDCKIVTEENKNELSSYAKLSRRCLKKKGTNRPFMEDILMELNRLDGLFG